MNKAELIDAVSGKTGLQKAEATRAVDAVFDSITAALKGGDTVALLGFGQARVITGANASLAVVELAPGAIVPGHQHAHEQLGLCLVGSITFTVGDETRELGPGGTWRVHPHGPAARRRGRTGRRGRRGHLRARAGRLGGPAPLSTARGPLAKRLKPTRSPWA